MRDGGGDHISTALQVLTEHVPIATSGPGGRSEETHFKLLNN